MTSQVLEHDDTKVRALGSRLVWPLACFAASRVVMFIGVLMVRFLQPVLTPELVLRAWDAGWYHRIVVHGYTTHLIPLVHPHDGRTARLNTLPFFPAYPLLSRVIHVIFPVGPLVALELVALFFGAVASVLFFELTRRRFGTDVAERATLLFVFFPGAWVLGYPYAEAMMLTFALLCLLALDEGHWIAAGCAAAVATATRPNAIFLVPACAWAAFVAIRNRREWRALWAPLLAPIGILAYFIYLWRHTGDFFMWRKAEHRAWGEKFDFGSAVAHKVGDFLHHPLTDHSAVLVTASFVLTIVGLVAIFLVRLPVTYRIFAIGVAGLPLISHILVARPRFLLTAFPIIMAFGALIPKRYVSLVVPISAAAMVLVVVYYGYYSAGAPGFIPP